MGNQLSFVEAMKQILVTKQYPNDREFEEKFYSEPMYPRDRAKTCLILESLEESFSHKEQINFDEPSSKITIEHVMPQSLTDLWRRQLGRNYDTVHNKYVHTFGNLTLSAYNTDLKNFEFALKKKILLESHLEINEYFRSINRWRKKEIIERSRELAKKALHIWPYFGKVEREPPKFQDGMVPDKLIFMDREYDVSSWREVQQKLLIAIYEYDPDTYKYIVSGSPSDISKIRDSTYSKPLPNDYWMTSKLNDKRTFIRCRKIIELAGLSSGVWQIEYNYR